MRDRPRTEANLYLNEIVAQTIVYGVQLQAKGLYFEQPASETTS
jgi:hypothetical protein